MRYLRFLSVAATALFLAACSNEPSGEYIGEQGSYLEKIIFKSDNKVEVVRGGATRLGTYQVDGDQVIVIIGNDQETMSIDDKGCIGGGRLSGRYCKA